MSEFNPRNPCKTFLHDEIENHVYLRISGQPFSGWGRDVENSYRTKSSFFFHKKGERVRSLLPQHLVLSLLQMSQSTVILIANKKPRLPNLYTPL